jgi:hypothetical protein
LEAFEIDNNAIMRDVFEFLFSSNEPSTTDFEDVKVTLSKEEFNDFPCFIIDKENVSKYANMPCHICIETLKEKDEGLTLPCLHVFHKNCIKKWLCEEKVTCPVCRKDTRRHEEQGL